MDQELLQDLGGLRADGRKPLELRRIRVRLGVFKQADGSAYLEQGKTKVLATVYGPHQPRGAAARSLVNKSTKGLINCQYSTAVFSFGAGERKSRPRGDRKSQDRCNQLKHAMEAILNLDLFPKSQIDIFVEILQMDGGEFCAAVNAATLGLIDAGIPIKDYAIGCTVTLLDSSASYDKDDDKGIGILDSNYVEESSRDVTLSIVALPESNNGSSKETGLVVVAQGSGQRLHLSRLEAMKARALCGCHDIKNILDRAVRQHLTANYLPSLSNLKTSVD